GIHVREHAPRGGVDPAGRNGVVGERLAGGGVVDRARQLREVAGTHRERGYGRDERLPLLFSMALIVGEEERLVLHDRTAERSTELILLEVGLGAAGTVVDVGVRVE